MPYRFADAVLTHSLFRSQYEDVVEILRTAPVPLLDVPNVKKRKLRDRRADANQRYFFLPVDQIALNRHLDHEFQRPERAWDYHPLVVTGEGGPETGLTGDFKKNRVMLEVQFGNMARWYTDVFKFQLAYAQDHIDVAILVVPTKRFANLIDENVAQYERVARELPWAKMSLTLPILVIGIEPEVGELAAIRDRYNEAATELIRAELEGGRVVSAVTFDEWVAEESAA